ncbi:MAG: glycosyltransferase [Pseudomonadales bacterium]|nr:glycosyltransferase [Pseudomonadales bacterium]
MRILIDLQGAQGVNKHRGIGRYALSITHAIVRNCKKHEVLIALNGSFPETIDSIRASFAGILPRENIRVWYTAGPTQHQHTNNNYCRKSAELVREAFLASLKPDIVLLTSMFEGLNDNAVTSIGKLSNNIRVATILYDLIPFIYRTPYLENKTVESWYENKLDHLRRSNLFLSISESAREEGIHYLGLPEDIVVNISTGADPQFQPVIITNEKEIRGRYNLKRPYVMYTGGIDHRKNIEGLIRAYSKLPITLRSQHQLAIICSIQESEKKRLLNLAKQHQLTQEEIVLTGFVPEDDLLALYRLCKLFVFPSWHEGFGLPALEAMSCGKAVIGANTSSIPEVIGRQDALFDPKCDESITKRLAQVLTNNEFRIELEQHGLEQAKKFSWDRTAKKAIIALEKLHGELQKKYSEKVFPIRRPKLAYVSPLPPVRSGISDYSAELLPQLSRHYDIDVIITQNAVSDPWINANCIIRDITWFKNHADHYERVLYHFGNSHFHQHMFNLLDQIPGVVVLHDFFLSSVIAHMDFCGLTLNGWTNELYLAHGYKALQERYHAQDFSETIWKYPANLSVLRGAKGIIVHSEGTRKMAASWYESSQFDHWAVIPLLRTPPAVNDSAAARQALGLHSSDFVICSFGLLGRTKLNHRLLEAWLASELAKDRKCILVFVGENEEGEYGEELLEAIQRSGLSKQIRITGWTDTDSFRHYLASADIGVQLRTLSRGETSAAVLDCMNYAIPTILNANGSLADIPDDVVLKLPDSFSNTQLVEAIESLRRDACHRAQLGNNARKTILNNHSPHGCADQYSTAIERFYSDAENNLHSLAHAIAKVEASPTKPKALLPLAKAIAQSIPPNIVRQQLLVDVSELIQRDSKSGIQRVVRNILQRWLNHPPEGFQVEPVYATEKHGYRYARRFTLEFLNCPTDILSDEPIEYRPGDIFIGLDLQPSIVVTQRGFYQQLRRHGVQVRFVVYDLLCISMPQSFVKGAGESYQRWLEVVAENDDAICISKAVADELKEWVDAHSQKRLTPFKASWFHLGTDIDYQATSYDLPREISSAMVAYGSRPTFLMVGTLEPRKGHTQTLIAFEQLWADGIDANLTFVGKKGWEIEALIQKLHQHPEINKRLFWLDGADDKLLDEIYNSSTCLIAASEGEGFGLPLIEAAQHKLPIIARDIPVFKEIAGEHAFYFKGLSPNTLSLGIRTWLNLYSLGQHPLSGAIPWLTWAESADKLSDIILKTNV